MRVPRVAPKMRCAAEARFAAMTRLLDREPPAILIDAGARRALYAAAAIAAVTPAEDAEAVRRSLFFRVAVAPRPTRMAA